jgi:transposase
MVAQKAPAAETLVDLYVNHHLSTDTIAARYGIHKTVVARHLRNAGVTMRKKGNHRPDAKPKPPREVLAAHLAAGWTYGEIAAEYNVNVDSVRRWVREEGLQAQVQGRANKRPPKRPANLLGPDFHPVEIDKKSLPLQGPALRLPEEQQRKVGRLLAIYQMRWEERYRNLLMRQEAP